MYCVCLKIVRHEFVPILGDVKDLQWDQIQGQGSSGCLHYGPSDVDGSCQSTCHLGFFSTLGGLTKGTSLLSSLLIHVPIIWKF